MQLTLRINADTPEALLESLEMVASDIRRCKTQTGQTQLSMQKRGWFANWRFDDYMELPENQFSNSMLAKGIIPGMHITATKAAASVTPQSPILGAAFKGENAHV